LAEAGFSMSTVAHIGAAGRVDLQKRTREIKLKFSLIRYGRLYQGPSGSTAASSSPTDFEPAAAPIPMMTSDFNGPDKMRKKERRRK
jgi:hypothetical protein